MSGHSKWHTIKHRKGAQDKLRGKLFTKHAKLIAIAAKNGMDPEMNPSLKTAILNAKADNVPNDNIKRAIQKGGGEGKDAVNYTECAYEGYAFGGIALIIDTLTDNSNRTYTSLHTAMMKGGGSLGALGSVSWMFQTKGSMELDWDGKNQEDLEMAIIEAGAEDMEFNEDKVFITTAFEDLGKVRDALQAQGLTPMNVKKDKVAGTRVEVKDQETAEKLFALIERIEDDEDVSEVFHNADIAEEILAKMEE